MRSDPGFKIGLVCVGGGSGIRFGGDKLRESLSGQSVFSISVNVLAEVFPDRPTVAVVPADALDFWSRELRQPGNLAVVAGGERRQDSVRAGVGWAADHGAEIVLVHDAARPLVHPDDVAAAVAGLEDVDGAVLCARVADTVKRVDGRGIVTETIDRGELRLSQTPQVFRVDVLQELWEAGDAEILWTDEAAMFEHAGMSVRTVVAEHPNPKLTTSEDLDVIRAVWKARS